jgi:hypothetical protein
VADQLGLRAKEFESVRNPSVTSRSVCAMCAAASHRADARDGSAFSTPRSVRNASRPAGQVCACSGEPANASIASPSASFWVGWACSKGLTSVASASQLTMSCASPISSPTRSPTR